MQEQHGRAYLPPPIRLSWTPIEGLLGCEAPDGFREQAEGYAWQIVAQSWETHPTPRERVAGEWRKLSRRYPVVRACAPKGAKGRPFSLTWFDNLILAFDFYFPGLECKGNSWANPKSWSGQFPEIIFEVLRQVGSYMWTDDLEHALRAAGIRGPQGAGRIGLPTGTGVQAPDDRAKKAALDAIGRRIHDLRKGERRDSAGMRQLGAGEALWRRPV